MGKRRDGREAAIQFLFSRDINKDLGPDDFDTFFSLCIAPAGARKFAKELLTGMLDNLEEIDTKLEPELENFELNRLSTIDRNVLRLATYEMFYLDDAHPIVCINESIEISKRFGTEDSGSFVNGVLDKMKDKLDRPLR